MSAVTAGKGKIEGDEAFNSLNKALDEAGYTGDDIISLPATVKIGNNEYLIQKDGTVDSKDENDNDLIYDTSITNPEGALPTEGRITQSSATEGIVMIDSKQNEWAWVEVPKTIYLDRTYNEGISPEQAETAAISNGKTADEAKQVKLNKIEDIMKKYANTYRNENCSDIWYGAPLVDDEYNYTSLNANTEGLTANQKADNTGCGLTYDEYYNLKNKMLQSVYDYGGFWVGRYEVGKDGDKLVIQQNKYLYNDMDMNVGKAQTKMATLATGGKTSSLMFGIQWDLMLKYIEEKGYMTNVDGTINPQKKITSAMLTGRDSKLFGNTWDAEFTVNRGEYYTLENDTWSSIDKDNSDHIANKIKKNNGYILLTTGAADVNRVLGIYDFVGNLQEMTLEFSNESSYNPVTMRGGNFYNFASDYPANSRTTTGVGNGDTSYGVRPALY